MIYTKEITRDLVKEMTKHRADGKTVDSSARATTRYLNSKYNSSLNWGSVRSKFYEAKPRKTQAVKTPESVDKQVLENLNNALSDLATMSYSITVEIKDKAVTVIYK